MGKNRRKNQAHGGGQAGDGVSEAAAGVAGMALAPGMAGVQPSQQPAGRGRGRGRGRAKQEADTGDDFPALGGGGPRPQPQHIPGMAPRPGMGGPPPGMGGPPPGMGGPPPGMQGPPPGMVSPREPQSAPPPARAPARSEHQPQGKIQTVTVEELADQHYQALDLVPPKRPGYGKRAARQIQLFANHFRINLNLSGQIQHYDVDIKLMDPPAKGGSTERKLPKGLTRRLMDLVGSSNPHVFGSENGKIPVVYDGVANMYTPVELKLDPPNYDSKTFAVTNLSERGTKETFSIQIKWAATIVLSDIKRYMSGDIAEIPQNAVNAIDNVFRQNALSRSNMVGVGRSFYIQPQDPQRAHLGEGREIWMGYFQSARISNQKSLTLNVDITATTFYPEQNCVTFANEFLRIRGQDTRPLKEMQILKLRREMTGLKCEYKYAHIKRSRKVTSVTLRSAATQMFTLDSTTKKQMSVAKYFQDKHKIQLRCPHMPCIQFGRRDGQTYIPMELCTILGGQRGQRKMTSDQTSNMIRRTAMPPADRKREIDARVRESNFANDPYTRAFGIGVDTSMTQLGGRVLQPPSMIYEGQKSINPRAGAWDPKFLKFYKSTAEPVKNWGMVNFDDRTDGGRLQNFLEQMRRHADKLGLRFTDPAITEGHVPLNRARDFLVHCHGKGIGFLICVLPGNNIDIYGQIKAMANVEFGIMTQCLKGQTVGKCNPMLLGNVLQKVNAKLGGVNHVPHDQFLMQGVMGRPTIIFGADVTHPAPGDRFRPSIAAMVASMDRNACKYESRSAVQAHRKEIIVDLAALAKDLLMAFYRNTNQKPERIIFYRDGVSEGQFAAVLNEELRALQKACTELDPTYKPGITFLVVQKRHHTRFFPVNQNDGEGKHRNVPAGTVVDHTVTHPTEFDFFLCSHAGIQGTSKPAHYHVLWDDNNLSADDLQALSFYLCHCYSNCSRSVSIPAPAYYAHKVAALARLHLEPVFESGSDHSGSSCSSLGEPTDEMRKAIKLADNLPKMFFL